MLHGPPGEVSVDHGMASLPLYSAARARATQSAAVPTSVAPGTIAERAAIVREGLDDLLLKRARLPPGSVRRLAEKQDHVIVRAGRTPSARDGGSSDRN